DLLDQFILVRSEDEAHGNTPRSAKYGRGFLVPGRLTTPGDTLSDPAAIASSIRVTNRLWNSPRRSREKNGSPNSGSPCLLIDRVTAPPRPRSADQLGGGRTRTRGVRQQPSPG